MVHLFSICGRLLSHPSALHLFRCSDFNALFGVLNARLPVTAGIVKVLVVELCGKMAGVSNSKRAGTVN